ncbi:hypothetical protein CFE53_04370 [Methanofervidicoccus sp. A16]|uniref:DUF2341 domain-containing protein n=1 Tax=Methanofervidicoccus sp. A16 TaxID=2607662 RepID=UPI00118D0852|nr:DUF2341 domain-containing protein [Methanofervidicoccus sp. A16]AXI25405.1 hypothetical protein CFE53_04370 [Methanofervidicoccus sp. A16]
MIGLSKLRSNKGYIFTFEAIVAVMIVLLIFYVGYFTITHNILTFHEEKRDIEAFEKSNLIANKLFKDHEFPSNSYVPDYLRFVDRVRERYYTSRDTIPGTFDPFSVRGTDYEGIATYESTWEYIINISNPNDYDLEGFQVLVTLTPSNFNFDFSPDGKSISFWENDSGTLEEIPYWIEIWEYNKIGRVWIKVNKIPRNGYTIIYLRRNQSENPDIRDNGEAVFIFFDDFEDGKINDTWKILRGEWEVIEDSELPFYNGGSEKNHVAHLKASSERYRSIISRDSLKVSNGDIYILEAIVKGRTGAQGGSADSPDTMVGFYADSSVRPGKDNQFYNSFTGCYQIFAICRNYNEEIVSSSNIFTYDNIWYYEKFILEHSDSAKNRICNASIWRFFNGHYGDPNPNDNTDSMVKTHCEVDDDPSNQRYILLGTASGTHSEEYWFDNVKVRKYAPRVGVTVRENLMESVETISLNVTYYFRGTPDITSNVHVINITNTGLNSSNLYVKTKNLLVPVKMWRYPSNRIISENITMGEILYFGTRRPSTLEYINISAPQDVDVVLSVNGVPFRMHISSTPTLSEFGKVINTHNWDMHQPNEIKIMNISQDVPITLNIVYSEPSTIYVLKLKPANISCIIPLKN